MIASSEEGIDLAGFLYTRHRPGCTRVVTTVIKHSLESETMVRARSVCSIMSSCRSTVCDLQVRLEDNVLLLLCNACKTCLVLEAPSPADRRGEGTSRLQPLQHGALGVLQTVSKR